MSDLDYLVERLKVYHDAKDAKEVADIICDIRQLDFLRQQGNTVEIDNFINGIVWKYPQRAAEHDKGLPQSQNTEQRAISCRRFLVSLCMEKLEKKAVGKLGEEALKHLGGNPNVH